MKKFLTLSVALCILFSLCLCGCNLFVCSICEDTGQTDCKICEGDGTSNPKNCYRCEGRGYFYEKCHACFMTGKIGTSTCSVCKGNLTVKHNCGSCSPNEQCWACKGKGKQDCFKCKN